MLEHWLQRLPGSRGTKVLATTLLIVVGTGYQTFRKGNGRQGEDLFSQDRPESIRAAEEQQRRQWRGGDSSKE